VPYARNLPKSSCPRDEVSGVGGHLFEENATCCENARTSVGGIVALVLPVAGCIDRAPPGSERDLSLCACYGERSGCDFLLIPSAAAECGAVAGFPALVIALLSRAPIPGTPWPVLFEHRFDLELAFTPHLDELTLFLSKVVVMRIGADVEDCTRFSFAKTGRSFFVIARFYPDHAAHRGILTHLLIAGRLLCVFGDILGSYVLEGRRFASHNGDTRLMVGEALHDDRITLPLDRSRGHLKRLWGVEHSNVFAPFLVMNVTLQAGVGLIPPRGVMVCSLAIGPLDWRRALASLVGSAIGITAPDCGGTLAKRN
jgi:hypothetical protein